MRHSFPQIEIPALIFLSLTTILFSGAIVVSAQTTCLSYPSNSTPPSGYGTSWNVFTSARELLVKTNCPTGGTNLTLTVGSGDSTQAVYRNAYSYRPDLSSTNPWRAHPLSGTTLSGDWLTGQGTASISAPTSASATNPMYFVGYVCTNRSGSWKCGCDSPTCATGKWQLQGYKGGSTGGGTTACYLKNDQFLNPFNKNSAHHKPIGTGAIYAPVTDERHLDFAHFGRFGINVGSPWGNYAVRLDEPGVMVTVNKKEADANGLPATVPMPAGGVVLDSDEADNQIVVFDMNTGGRMHHVRGYQWRSGNPVGMQYRSYAFNSLGHGVRDGDRIGTTASGVAAPFGILRGYEANTPGVPIQHALQMIGPRRDGPACPNVRHMLGRTHILPAVSMDGNALTVDEYNLGSIPYGTLFAIPPESKGGPRLESLGLSEPGLRLARAIRDYGIYLIDGGGCGPAIRADQDVDKNLFMNEIPKFYNHIRVVDNSEWNPAHDATGGGTPIAPNCAFDAL